MNNIVRPLATVAILLLGLASQVVAAPTVFWSSEPVQPVQPGQTVVVIGEGFGEKPKIEVARLPDGPSDHPASKSNPPTEGFVALDAIQASDQGLKFTVRPSFQPGIFAYRIVTDAGNVFVRRVRVRADVYRGHPTEAEVDKLFRAQMRLSTGGGPIPAAGEVPRRPDRGGPSLAGRSRHELHAFDHDVPRPLLAGGQRVHGLRGVAGMRSSKETGWPMPSGAFS